MQAFISLLFSDVLSYLHIQKTITKYTYLGEVKTLVLLFIILKKLLVLTLFLDSWIRRFLLLLTVDNSSSSSTDFLGCLAEAAMTPASDVVGLTWLCIWWVLRSAAASELDRVVVLKTDSDTVLMRSMSPLAAAAKSKPVQVYDDDLCLRRWQHSIITLQS